MSCSLHPETFQHNYDTDDAPLAKFAGQVAYEQLVDDLDVVNEQPTGSSLCETEPWPAVLQHPRVTSEKFDQCQLGQRNSKGEHVKKPAELVASGSDLLCYVRGLKCGKFRKRCNGNRNCPN